jgi:ribosome-associated toxin RatA of RatAB toxin-antitoxin module
MPEEAEDMTELRIWTTRQTVKVDAPPKRVFELVANIDRWPALFDTVTGVERLGFEGVCERVRFGERSGNTWTSVRETNPKRLQVRFRQVDPRPPFASMGGLWLVVPKAAGAVIALDHYYRVLDDSPVTAARMEREIAATSTAMLGTLRRTAEFGGMADLIASSVTPERESSS